MKAVILKEDLDKVMSIVSRIVVSRGQLPVLNNVLIVVNKSSIIFSATNLEIGISLTVGGKIFKEGSITVPAKNMAEFVALAGSADILLEATDEKLKLTAGKTTALFTGIAAVEFPVMPTVGGRENKLNTISLERKRVNQVAEKVGYAASVDEARLVLTGVKFYKSEGKLRVVATDGFRLSRLDLVNLGKEEKNIWPDNLIIPARTIGELSRFLGDKNKEVIEMIIVRENNQVIFSGTDFMLASRILDGNFPDVDKIIPSEWKTKAVIDRKDLIEAVRTAAIFARENSNIVRFKIQDSKCKVSAAGAQTGEEESEIPVETEGDEVEIAFNFKYVLDLLNSMDADKIVLEANGGQAAVVFKMEGEEELVAIIMPVRV